MSSPPDTAAPPAEKSLRLVPVAPGELVAVSEMAALIWPAAYGAILPAAQIDHMLRRMYAPEKLRADLADGVAMWWVLRGGDRIGFLAAGPVDATGLCPLHKCYLLPSAQRCGNGSEALARLCETLARDGARLIELRVNRHNSPAIAFYLKNGFSLHAEDCRPIGAGFVMDDYLMRRPLD